MVATHRTVKVTPQSSIDELLTNAESEPVLLEKNGVVYRLTREDANEEDIWSGYDPERARQVLDDVAGIFSDIDADALIAAIYEARGRHQLRAGR
jgi:hypothetical protein